MQLIVPRHTGSQLLCQDAEPPGDGGHVAGGLKGLGRQHGLRLVLDLHCLRAPASHSLQDGQRALPAKGALQRCDGQRRHLHVTDERESAELLGWLL